MDVQEYLLKEQELKIMQEDRLKAKWNELKDFEKLLEEGWNKPREVEFFISPKFYKHIQESLKQNPDLKFF